MNDDTVIDPATERFRQSLPYTLLHVSPTLAADVQSRSSALARTDQDDNHAATNREFCSKCGYSLFLGDSETRSVRVRSKRWSDAKTRKMKQTVCGRCGDVRKEAIGSAPMRQARPSSPELLGYSSVSASPTPTMTSADKSVAPAASRHESRSPFVPSTSSSKAPTPSRIASPSSVPIVTPTSTNDRRSSREPSTTSSGSGKRPKKMSVLQEMLSRNRRDKARDSNKQDKNGSAGGIGGLTAFLSEL